jgi:hypothetical protein
MKPPQGPQEFSFHLLKDGTRELVFPCDEAGQVNLDTLSEHERTCYFWSFGLFIISG